MWRPRILPVCILLLLGQSVSAQDPAKHFGEALTKFYRADYEGAVADFNRAASAGLKDGRLYLFRGISRLRLGDEDGRSDLELATEYEAKVGSRYVGRLAERLQDSEAALISDLRSQAMSELQTSGEDTSDTSFPQRKSIANMTASISLDSDDTDPFLDDSLGRGQIVEVVATSSDENEIASDTGSSLNSNSNPFTDDDPGFAEFGAGDEFAGADDDVNIDVPSASNSPKKKRGLFGTIFRAVGKSVVPEKAAEQLMNQLPIPGGPSTQPAGPPPGFGDGNLPDDDELETGFEGFGDDSDGFEDFDFGSDADEGNPFENDP